MDNEDNPLKMVTPIFERKSTSRYYSNSPNIQALSNSLRSIIKAPKGYKVLSIDVKQQEPVIFFNWLIPNKNMLRVLRESIEDNYMGITRVCLSRQALLNKINPRLKHYEETGNFDGALTDEQLGKYVRPTLQGRTATKNGKILLLEGVIFDYIFDNLVDKSCVDKTLRSNYKTAILAGGYGGSEGLLAWKTTKEIGSNLFHLLHNIPEMIDYEEKSKRYINSGNRVFLSAFGTSRILDEKKGFDYMRRCAINTPIQTTAADMLSFAIQDINQWTLDNKYTTNDLRLLYPRHDEVLYYIKDNILDRAAEVADLLSLQVEDWTPILVEYSYNDCYIGK